MDYLDIAIEELNKNFKLTQIDNGEYKKIDKSMMHFLTDSYTIEGVGKLSIMHMKAMLGLMRMTSLIITPLNKEMPLLSIDKIKAFGSTSLIIELYNTSNDKSISLPTLLSIKDKYNYIEDIKNNEPHWYDYLLLKESIHKKDKKHKAELDLLNEEYVKEYISLLARSSEPINKEEKITLTQQYVNTLVTKGGPAVNQFKKLIGEEKTSIFLKKYFFGSED